MKSSKYANLRLAINCPSRCVSNLQFYSGQIPFRKALGEIQENMIEDSFSLLEEGTPRHIPTSYQKASIDLNNFADLDKTILQDPMNLVAVRTKEMKPKLLPLYKQKKEKITLLKREGESVLGFFSSIMKGDINHCILCLNQKYE